MDPSTVADMFRQIISGEDIPKIHHLLKRMSPQEASLRQDDSPYSILTILAHADFWQTTWLARIEGTKRPKFQTDWRIPDQSEFKTIRESFLSGLDRASEIASNWPILHEMPSDDKALHLLVSLAIHSTYHVGQIKLLATMNGLAATK